MLLKKIIIPILALTTFFNTQLNAQETCAPTIPTSVEFADQTISLDRYDLRERFDREQLVATFYHSNSILQLKRANRLFPIIEPILKKNGVPDDFKYLASIESNLDPRAISGAQAAGLWQFMPKTAQQFGLEVNDEIDERYHIEKSTEAACKYLKSAYAKYNNWASVAISYNAGMGRISGELDKQNSTGALDLLLTSESSRYIFRILAMKRFMENPKAYGFILQREDFYHTIRTKNIEVRDSVTDWAQWAQNQGISYYQLKDFNIWLRDRKLVNSTKKTYLIKVPEKEDLNFNPSKIFIHNIMWVEL